MSDELTAVVASAFASAESGDSGDSGDSGADSGDTDTGADNSADISGDNSGGEPSESTEGEGDSSEADADNSEDTSGQETGQEEAEKEPEPVEEEEPAEKTQLEKDLEELGIRDPKPGERINKIPQPRVKTMITKAIQKVEARAATEISGLRAENTRLAKSAQTMKNIDKLIDSGEAGVERFMTLLSTMHPGKFDKYLGNAKAPAGQKSAKVAGSAAESKVGPRPGPDVTFEDKSKGYSPEQHDKLLDWVAAKAREEAKAEAIAEMEERMEAKYGKIAKDYESREAFNEELPKVQAVIQGVHETWGKALVEKHEDAIVALMQQYPEMTTQEAVARVLVPLVRADRNKQRQSLIKETKQRTAAAAKVVPGGAAKDTNEPKTLDDVIRRSIRAAGIK